MQLRLRQGFFRIFAIFFVLITPFLAIYSLGYDLDFNSKSLANTLTISIDTFPHQVEIYNGQNLVKSGAGELKAKDNQLIPLSIKANGYLTEDFTLWAKPNENTTARLNNLWLLPQNSDNLQTLPDVTFLSILSDNLVLFRQGSDLYVQLYSFGGLQGSKQLISKAGYIQAESSGRWETLLEDMFWSRNQGLLLYKLNGKWSIIDLQKLPFAVRSVAKIKDNKAVLLTQTGELWSLDLNSGEPNFLDQGFQGLAYTNLPDALWLWKNDTIWRIDRQQLETNDLEQSRKVYSTNSILLNYARQDGKEINFKVKTLFQGLAFLVDTQVFYVPDFDKNVWESLAQSVISFGTDSSSLIWLDDKQNLYVYNLLLKEYHSFGKIDLKGDSRDFVLNYYYPWRRVLVYSPTQVFTVWYDKEILNDGVVGYKPQQWVGNSFCRTNILDRYEFCLSEHSLQAYKNTAIW